MTSTGPLPDYQVRAKNIAAQSENKIHSDDVARAFGFTGALVSGVAVFGYMSRPLVERYGIAWLEGGAADVSFGKPAYEGDLLTVRDVTAANESTEMGTTADEAARKDEGEAPGGHRLILLDTKGAELARLASWPDAAPAPLDRLDGLEAEEKPGAAERAPVSWEGMAPGRPLWRYQIQPSREDNAAWAESVMDDLPLYREGEAPPLHPGLVLRAANRVLSHTFVLPAWIHVASRVHFRRALRAGEAVAVHAVPVERYEKRGHQFAVVHMSMTAGGAPAVEVRHTLIFRVRQAA